MDTLASRPRVEAYATVYGLQQLARFPLRVNFIDKKYTGLKKLHLDSCWILVGLDERKTKSISKQKQLHNFIFNFKQLQVHAIEQINSEQTSKYNRASQSPEEICIPSACFARGRRETRSSREPASQDTPLAFSFPKNLLY